MMKLVKRIALAFSLLGLPAAAAAAVTPAGIANGCFNLTRGGASIRAEFAKPTGLGTFVLAGPGGELLAVADRDHIARVVQGSPAAEWAISGSRRGGWTLRSRANGRMLGVDRATGKLELGSRAAHWRFRPAQGCFQPPEAEVGASGRPFRGRLRDGTVYGFADAHLHVTADLRAGGRVIHGKVFDRFGITEALGHDEDDHGSNGVLDVTGNLLRTGSPVGTHDTHGWPTFAGWPTFDTNTHQQAYYVWLQRMWMAGMRLLVAQVVEDEPLCRLEPLRSHSCDETETVKLSVARLRELRDYVDAQNGGRGRGWLRLVSDPRSARRAIERGKLALLIGVESSNPFGCSVFEGMAQCTEADVDHGIDLYRSLGISTIFITHWVDNAFAGAALEGGDKGLFISTFEVTQTGSFFDTEPCPEPDQGEEPQPAAIYPPGKQCNSRGLTPLGEYVVKRLMDNHILIEADHLSEKARLQVLKMAEARRYPLVSSHTGTGGPWSESTLRRLFALGGFATARPAPAAQFAQAILRFRAYRAKGKRLGVGLGSDTGGFSSLPGPDTTPGHTPLPYPFRSFDGRVTFERQRTGERVFDYNRDGVAHYGLFADLLADTARQAGGHEALRLLFRSAEAYLRMWERAERQ